MRDKVLVPVDRLHITDEQAEIIGREYPDGMTAAKAKVLKPLAFSVVEVALIVGVALRPEQFIDLTWVAIVGLWLIAGVPGIAIVAVACSDDKASPEIVSLLRRRPLVAGSSMLISVSWAVAIFLAEACGRVLLGLLRMVVATKITKAIEDPETPEEESVKS